ncbi:integrase [Streptomyces sp. H39-C1]|uniref:integrase n=1 Tax=Streptomyces sp. H39-C1 TaxID=3004355 RepID=UPI0022AFFAA6|nr:integrase [Streptomyces sp. H39-C1]MCZ4098063.1 integrase [Streptomyces sp. H39-C1]
MTAVPAVETDPYILATPTPNSPVVLLQWILPDNRHPNGRYRDPVWPLAPLIDNPSTSLRSISWKLCPAEMRDQLRRVTWCLINGQLRPTYLQTRGPLARSRTSPGEMRHTCYEWFSLARWLAKQGITSVIDCTPELFAAYAAHRADGISRDQAQKVLGRLTDLWAFDQIAAQPLGILQPPWVAEGIDDYLPEEKGAGGENSTEPLDPQVIGPLLVWAIRMVEDFADDILAAWAERRRMADLASTTLSTPKGRAALEAYLLPLARSGAPLPTTQHKGTVTIARNFIAAMTGASVRQVDMFKAQHGLARLAAERPGPCPLPLAVTGHINGRPWRKHMDFDEVNELRRHLGTAAAVICLYLTGMRPQEVQGLRSGCCPDPGPRPDGTAGRHLIYSYHFKNVTDDDGNHLSAGEERAVPWTAIIPVVRAIRVLERMVPEGELLLSAAHLDAGGRRGGHGALKAIGLNYRVEDFVAWANREAHAQGLSEQSIPEDPHGRIWLSRFRRTLAWHVARRPGGLIALAIQYGHMRTILDARTSIGYGTRSRRGIHAELDIETVRAAADTAAKLNDRMAAGEKISGPAARRALTAAAITPRFEGRIVTSKFAKKAATFLARDGLVLFDNPDAHLICVFKRDNALCEPESNAVAPNQFACELGCGNAVRTDAHAVDLRIRARELDSLAAAAPEPVGRRLKHNADRLRAVADIHDATAQSAEAVT